MSYWDVPDHPVVASLLRYGTPDGQDEECPHCPVCGQECEEIYQDRDMTVVGCDQCVSFKDAWECDECFK